LKHILIAGIGNIFLGDDAFGVEVVRELQRRPLPPEVRVRDFGIRGYDLACALADGCDTAILVDATPRGDAPGTVYLIEPDLAHLLETDGDTLDSHGMDPVRTLQLARAFGGCPQHLYLVGCEPGELGAPDGRMGLSGTVQSAVPRAADLIESLVNDLLQVETTSAVGAFPE